MYSQGYFIIFVNNCRNYHDIHVHIFMRIHFSNRCLFDRSQPHRNDVISMVIDEPNIIEIREPSNFSQVLTNDAEFVFSNAPPSVHTSNCEASENVNTIQGIEDNGSSNEAFEIDEGECQDTESESQMVSITLTLYNKLVQLIPKIAELEDIVKQKEIMIAEKTKKIEELKKIDPFPKLSNVSVAHCILYCKFQHIKYAFFVLTCFDSNLGTKSSGKLFDNWSTWETIPRRSSFVLFEAALLFACCL